MRTRSLISGLAIWLVVDTVVLVTAMRRGPDSARERGPAAAAETPASGDHRADVMGTTLFRNMAKRENPIVVYITTKSRLEMLETTESLDHGGFLQRFFGGPAQSRDRLMQGLGSGFVISQDGEILTNNHVVAGAEQIRVGLSGNTRQTYVATLLGRDPLTDSALIKLKGAPHDLAAATLGDSDALEPGDWVMAIGNAFQLGPTVTVGVVSYRGRPFAVTEGRFQNTLQTDASINPGNSGGPLFNIRDEVVGINTAILAGEGSAGDTSVGFAIPINTVKALLPQLRQGRVRRGRLGVQIQNVPITNEEAKGLGLPKPEGVIVSMVERGSPAERAGLRAGDVIVAYDSKPVVDADGLMVMVAATRAGLSVPITFFRNGTEQAVTATIGELEFGE